jgi:hypothetical protein
MSRFGTRAFWHNEYKFGDEDHGIDPLKYDSFNEMAAKVFGKDDVYRIVYISEHNKPVFSTVPFKYPWDSDKLGFIFARSYDIKRRFGEVTKITKMLAEALLIDEVGALSKNLQPP